MITYNNNLLLQKMIALALVWKEENVLHCERNYHQFTTNWMHTSLHTWQVFIKYILQVWWQIIPRNNYARFTHAVSFA